MVYEALDCIRYLAPQCLEDFPKLKEFKSRIEVSLVHFAIGIHIIVGEGQRFYFSVTVFSELVPE
ncbi:Fh47 [Fasciola hepatica]|uniref:Fh47 n=1 Tax=Fasciola hepatica TaxID=6192 RepID=A0A4E0R0J1_FASHE|nr:Fh47 [Fasciola hepatica]